MAPAILPGLTIELHDQLRDAWAHQLSVDSVGSTVGDAVLLERDLVRRFLADPGSEVLRRLGEAPKVSAAALSIANARNASRLREYTRGLTAVLRLVTAGKQFGVSDLGDLVRGGPVRREFAPLFANGIGELVLAQRALGVRWRDRLQTTAVVESDQATPPGRALGR